MKKSTQPHFIVLTLLIACFWPKSTFAGTPDRDSDPITKEDKAYFLQVKDAILHDRRNWLADHIFLPLSVFPAPGKESIKTKRQFLEHYSEIINPYVCKAIENQKAENLFKNWEGIMIGDGAIWINQLGPENSNDGPWTYYIVTINNRPYSADAEK